MCPPRRSRGVLNQDMKDEIAEVFEIFDADKSGCIYRNELKVGMRAMGFQVTKQDIEAIFKSKDLDNLGYLDFKQFREVITEKMMARPPEDEFKHVFALFDKDNIGKICFKDIERVCNELDKKDLKPEEMKAMIRQFDEDEDGYITQAEFIRMMNGLR